jgi:2'-5' RNA ligase
MKEIAIVCLLPEEITKYHQVLRHQITTKFKLDTSHNFPAHITLKYGFPVRNLAEIESVVEEFCISETRRTSWRLCDFNRFLNPPKYVVFIDAVALKGARAVHARFLNKLREINWVQWGPYDNGDMHYHVTLATQGLTSENHEAVWSFVNQQSKPDFEVLFDNLALVQIEDESATIYKTYRFPLV